MVRPVSLHLVRHGSAGHRGSWPGDDLERPLDERGTEQARRLAEHLGDAPIQSVWSSIA
ncbi:MAG: histidine phosphatase family protein, partial [Actinobacteria bacterium]|nr:histidine phosphatase family protein [Actinomycetota bacterium]NIS34097.1 histidine phosphatase family protein [Actinomycetota bacterium]NIT97246.1 histidine phosphatase family protein [Actinomycetota bacterium]NIU20934.1 histidine phosphatase family protein [Actinomycetota bacterium]NIU68894.1 histidine phosphatase family protein [Actinomycetota bacterium]